jgi:uncharacterized protein YqeY
VSKREEINNALKEAMKAREEVKVATLRLVMAAIKDRDIEARAQSKTPGDAEILSLLQSMIKQRQESLDTYSKAGRQDLAAREDQEITIIRTFMPQQLSENETKKVIDGLVSELNVKDIKEMGKVMAALKTRYAGQLDMTRASGMVRERLAG